MFRVREPEREIAGGESETVELKRSTGQLRRAAETLCAFLNTGGGKVIFGVAENGDFSVPCRRS
jgi:ATP-dependent DNA helicase RecG